MSTIPSFWKQNDFGKLPNNLIISSVLAVAVNLIALPVYKIAKFVLVTSAFFPH
jgi:hypothetical protein